MPKINKFRTLEEEILFLRQEAKAKSLPVSRILRILSGKGRPLIILLLCLPFCQPIQIPGFSVPFGLAIAFIGIRMAFGKKIWLPQKFLEKDISGETVRKIADKAIALVTKVKPWIHPRLVWFCHSPIMEKANGLIIFLLGILLALPLPIPLSNLVAAWSIFFIALGVLEDDGLFVIIGYVMSLLTALAFLFMVIAVKNLF